jgi:hypothetical protein
MVDQWELILHHTYSGTPGVVFDSSPARGSHGVALGLDQSDFSIDGQAAGSGSVRLHRNGRIAVTPTKGWDRLQGIRVEVLCRSEKPEGGGRLVDANRSFFLALHASGVDASFFGVSPVSLQRFSAPFDGDVIPDGWILIGVLHDGAATLEISLNGTVVKRWTDTPLVPVAPTKAVTIGSERTADLFFTGQIDDVKVWRPSPHKADDDFIRRVVKANLTDCWAEWGRRLRDALDELGTENPECPARIANLLDRAIASTVAQTQIHNRPRWEEAVTEYRRLWSAGHLDQIGPLLAGLVSALQSEGLDQNPDYLALVNDACWKELVSKTPPMDCDPQFTRMISGASEA